MSVTRRYILKYCVHSVLSINKQLEVTYTFKWNQNGLMCFQSSCYMMDVKLERKVSSAVPLGFDLGLCHGDGNVI